MTERTLPIPSFIKVGTLWRVKNQFPKPANGLRLCYNDIVLLGTLEAVGDSVALHTDLDNYVQGESPYYGDWMRCQLLAPERGQWQTWHLRSSKWHNWLEKAEKKDSSE